MSYYACLLGLLYCRHWSFGVEDCLQRFEVTDPVELVQVDVVDAETFQTQLEVTLQAFTGSRAGLGGDDDLLSTSLDGPAYARLAGGIGVGRVEEGNTQVEALPDHSHGLVIRNPLDGNATKTQSGDHHTGPAQSYSIHFSLLPLRQCRS